MVDVTRANKNYSDFARVAENICKATSADTILANGFHQKASIKDYLSVLGARFGLCKNPWDHEAAGHNLYLFIKDDNFDQNFERFLREKGPNADVYKANFTRILHGFNRDELRGQDILNKIETVYQRIFPNNTTPLDEIQQTVAGMLGPHKEPKQTISVETRAFINRFVNQYGKKFNVTLEKQVELVPYLINHARVERMLPDGKSYSLENLDKGKELSKDVVTDLETWATEFLRE